MKDYSPLIKLPATLDSCHLPLVDPWPGPSPSPTANYHVNLNAYYSVHMGHITSWYQSSEGLGTRLVMFVMLDLLLWGMKLQLKGPLH